MPRAASQTRAGLIAELRDLYAAMRPPRSQGVAQLLEMELTFSQLRVMFLLLDCAPARMSFIAQQLGIKLSSCTHVVDKLVAAGYVERSEDPDDRRVVQCSLTESGKKALDSVRQQSPLVRDDFIERLSDDELKTMIKATAIMQRVMAELDA